VDRSAIFVEAVGNENSAGTKFSGGDAASGNPSSKARKDAALNGALRLTVPTTDTDAAVL
jgi:hypothetical protein